MVSWEENRQTNQAEKIDIKEHSTGQFGMAGV